VRQMRSRCDGDNADGSRRDAKSNASNPVGRSVSERNARDRALEQRVNHGSIFFLLHLLSSLLSMPRAVAALPVLHTYAGFDCALKWATFLGDPNTSFSMSTRLSEHFGVADEEISAGRQKTCAYRVVVRRCRHIECVAPNTWHKFEYELLEHAIATGPNKLWT
jgi:hypothetical protein